MSASATDHSVSTPELAKASGATERQLDYWARRGYLRPVIDATGSGSRRRWSMDAINRARVMASLSKLSPQSQAPTRMLETVGLTDPPWVMRLDAGVQVVILQVTIDAVPDLTD